MSAATTVEQPNDTMENHSMTATAFGLSRRLGLLACLALAAIATTFAAAMVFASPASAAVQWHSEVRQAPTHLPPGGRGIVTIAIANTGDTTSTGAPTVSFTLPAGVTAGSPSPISQAWSCAGTSAVTCTFLASNPLPPYVHVSFPAAPGSPRGLSVLPLVVDMAPGASEGTFPLEVTLTGGGSSGPVTQTHQVTVEADQLPFGPTPGSFTAGAFDAAGDDYTQAGGHPDHATGAFKLNTQFFEPDPTSANGLFSRSLVSQGAPKDVVVDLPPGFVGDPSVGPKCSDLGKVAASTCPNASQVGVATISAPLGTGGTVRMFGVYNVEPPAGWPAQFAFESPVGTVALRPVVRSDGDLGISVHVKGITQADTLLESDVTLWGVPADPSHDFQRCSRPNFYADACVGYNEGGNFVDSLEDLYLPHSSSAPLKPFLSNPTGCSGDPVVTRAHFSSWESPGGYEPDGDPDLSDPGWVSTQDDAPPVTGCDLLSFDPVVEVSPTSSVPGASTGLEFELSVPQDDDPDGLATAHLRDTTVTLPEGMTVNPSSADGLAACTSSQIGLTSKSPVRFSKLEPSCPAASKIGTVSVDTPLLEDPLTGDVFLARQTDNPFDSLLAMYIVVRGPGILVKLAGHVESDPQTGRLSTTVLENPQVPFDSLKVTLKSGPRAPLTNPATCGTKTVTADLTSWAGHDVQAADSFVIDCPGNATKFDPGFSAGSAGLVAGAFSPFTARFTRDGGKELGRIDMTLPKGALAAVKDVAVCSDAQLATSAGKSGKVAQATPSCPASSQVGSTTVGAGSGALFFPTIPGTSVTGRVFLTGPHHATQFPRANAEQADYGLAIEVPAVAGPFDLGTVLVRAAIYVNPDTAQLSVVSDRLPRILQGIPLDVRDVRVRTDRKDFSVNPTSCEELQSKADIRAQDGTLVSRSARFQVGDCAALNVKPRIAMRLTGRKQTKLGGNPALSVRMRQGAGQANLATVKAILPASLALDAESVEGDWLCSYEQGLAATCPATSQVGTAKAWSPLLKRPVTGPVYFVKGIRFDPDTGNRIRTLPTLLLKLDGEAQIHLRASSSTTKGGRLVSTFAGVPDARVSRFDMRIRGGNNRGILTVSGSEQANLCNGTQTTNLAIRGQNGKLTRQNVKVKTPCPKPKKRKKLRLTR